jgi:hypothetical protein
VTGRRGALRLAAKALALGAAGGWAYAAAAPGEVTGLAADGARAHPWAASAAALRIDALTPDGGDRYDVVIAGDELAVSAPASNLGGNLRVALWSDADPVSTDQQAGVTFVSGDHERQPGVALRIRSGGGRVQAVTVTKSVWARSYWMFNVHVMDSAAPEPFRLVASFDLASRLVTDGRLRPYPWRICAEARGATLRFLVWSPSEPTPRWGDPTSGGQVTLPPGWDAPGRPGLFAGHLPAGRALGSRAVTTRAL